MTIALLGLLGLLGLDEDTYTVTLAFEEMHCDECKVEVEATVKRMQGFKSVQTAGKAVTVAFEDKAPVPAFNRLPKDLKLQGIAIEIRGTVSFSGDKATLLAKGSGTALSLANPERPKRVDKLGELKQQLGGKNRFLVKGALAGGRTIVVDSFQAVDWKDR